MSNELITFLGVSITLVGTTLGAALVYLIKDKVSNRINGIILGFASGVMIAASIFGLIIPSLEGVPNQDTIFRFIPTVVSVILGCLFLVSLDHVVPHKHFDGTEEGNPGNHEMKKSTKLFLAVTIHNIPEGIAVGFVFGNAYVVGTTAAFIAAFSLAIGIAIQNIPEGAILSLLFKDEYGNNKAFLLGFLSGVVEPIFAVLGMILAASFSSLLPWFLGFAAGAMIFVTVEDLIPDAKLSHKSHSGSWGFIIGFLVMMVLDSYFG